MPEELATAVAAEIRRLLAERRMTGRALALATGINPRSMDRKLAGTTLFDIGDLAAIAPVFGVTATDILGWAEKT